MVKQWKKEEGWPFFIVVQLIHRLTQVDISCTITASLFFFPLLGYDVFKFYLFDNLSPCSIHFLLHCMQPIFLPAALAQVMNRQISLDKFLK